jgi:hypothetical protein
MDVVCVNRFSERMGRVDNKRQDTLDNHAKYREIFSIKKLLSSEVPRSSFLPGLLANYVCFFVAHFTEIIVV